MKTEIHCKKCNRFLGIAEQAGFTVTLKCPNCKSLERFHYVRLSTYIPERATLLGRALSPSEGRSTTEHVQEVES